MVLTLLPVHPRHSRIKVLSTLLWCGLISFSTACFSGISATAEETQSNYFPMKKGYCWKYKWTVNPGEINSKVVPLSVTDVDDGILPDGSKWHELESSQKSEVSSASIPISRCWYVETTDWIRKRWDGFQKGADNTTGPGDKFLKIPLFPGFHWDAPQSLQTMPTSQPRQAKTETPRLEGTVSGPEDIIVPAGQFRTIKVITHHSNGCMPLADASWYAPNIGLVKREYWGNANSYMELTEYVFPKPEEKDNAPSVPKAVK
jgi:hypothetical protein